MIYDEVTNCINKGSRKVLQAFSKILRMTVWREHRLGIQRMRLDCSMCVKVSSGSTDWTDT